MHLIAIAATPTPAPDFDETQVTPGVIGFVITALFVVVVALLALDLVRRTRRVRYREESRARIAAELAAAEAQEAGGPADASTDGAAERDAPSAPGP
ncbi:MAG TPA: hypothetical protein VNQ48_04310 [Microbacteriaceae bacterium]|nr:hypothetical protein [Microbacteriaceae bacterium]